MRFEKYFEPETIKECSDLLAEYGDKAMILAGGTDVIPLLKFKARKPVALIDIRKIDDLNEVKLTDDGLNLGAMTRMRKLSLNKELKADYPVITEAAGRVSSMQIRNIATIGGNVCNASPSADAVQGLILMEASAVIESNEGSREVKLDDFFTGPGKTVLKSNEILTGFKVPKPAPRTGAFYEKFAIRGNVDVSIVGAGALIALADDATVAKAVISLASVAPTPVRVSAVENMIKGKKLTPELIEEAAKAASENVSPISDQRATKEYRKEMVRVWVKSALEKALARAMA